MTGDTHEIKNADLFNMFGDRHGSLLRRRDSAIVWPRRAVNVPEIPFESDPDTVRAVFRRGDAANKSVEDYLDELNRQRVGELVQPGVMPPRGNGGKADPHGKRETAERFRDDLCDVDYKQVGQAAYSRWAACENHECSNFARSRGCVVRQRSGRCPTLRGSGVRSDTRRVQSPGKSA